MRLGELAPEPIGYIEFYKSGLVGESFFVSERFESDWTIREVLLDKSFDDRDEIFREFARFTFKLHEKDIYHEDYSPGNILIKKLDDRYIFKVVDVNRMSFARLSLKKRLKNFNKLWASDEDIAIMIDEYAKLINVDSSEAIKVAQRYNKKNKYIKNMKKRLKGIEVVD